MLRLNLTFPGFGRQGPSPMDDPAFRAAMNRNDRQELTPDQRKALLAGLAGKSPSTPKPTAKKTANYSNAVRGLSGRSILGGLK